MISVDELLSLYLKAATDSNGAVPVPSDDVLRTMIYEADIDEDGQLSFEEFLNVVIQVA